MTTSDRTLQNTPENQLDLLHKTLLEEAAAGHFEPRLLDPQKATRMYNNLLSIIRTGKRTDEPLRAQLVSWMQADNVIGWLMNTEIVPGGGNEFWLVIVRSDWQGRGEGGRLLDTAIGKLGGQVDIYARTYPASITMEGLFLRRGFVIVGDQPDGNKTLKRPRDGTEIDPGASHRLTDHVVLSV